MSPSPVLPVHAQDVPEKTPLPLSPYSARSALTTTSNAVNNLDAVLDEIRQVNHDVTHLYGGEDEDEDEDTQGTGFMKKVNHSRAHLRHTLHAPAFHYTVIGLVILDLVIVFIDLVVSLLNLPCLTEEQLQWFEEHNIDGLPPTPNCKLAESPALEGGEWFLWAFSVFLLSLFTIELVLSLFAFGPKHFKKPIYFIDAIVVLASLILEVYFKVGDGGRLETVPSSIIALRLWKIVRAVHAIAHSIELKNQEIIKQVKLAKSQVEDSLDEVSNILESEQLKIEYLRQKNPKVGDAELEQYVDSHMRERRRAREESPDTEKTSKEAH